MGTEVVSGGRAKVVSQGWAQRAPLMDGLDTMFFFTKCKDRVLTQNEACAI